MPAAQLVDSPVAAQLVDSLAAADTPWAAWAADTRWVAADTAVVVDTGKARLKHPLTR
jgi:hypothetical protein